MRCVISVHIIQNINKICAVRKKLQGKKPSLNFFLCSLKETKLVFFLSSLYCKEFKKEIKWAYFFPKK